MHPEHGGFYLRSLAYSSHLISLIHSRYLFYGDNPSYSNPFPPPPPPPIRVRLKVHKGKIWEQHLPSSPVYAPHTRHHNQKASHCGVRTTLTLRASFFFFQFLHLLSCQNQPLAGSHGGVNYVHTCTSSYDCKTVQHKQTVVSIRSHR